MLELEYEFLCEVIANLDTAQIIGAGPYGVRRIVPVNGGTVTGPKLTGEVLPFGADWLLVRPDDVWELDVRGTIRTADGALIYVYYRGILNVPAAIWERITNREEVDPSAYYFRTTPIFETGSETYRWLNRIIAVGVGALTPGQVRGQYPIVTRNINCSTRSIRSSCQIVIHIIDCDNDSMHLLSKQE